MCKSYGLWFTVMVHRCVIRYHTRFEENVSRIQVFRTCYRQNKNVWFHAQQRMYYLILVLYYSSVSAVSEVRRYNNSRMVKIYQVHFRTLKPSCDTQSEYRYLLCCIYMLSPHLIACYTRIYTKYIEWSIITISKYLLYHTWYSIYNTTTSGVWLVICTYQALVVTTSMIVQGSINLVQRYESQEPRTYFCGGVRSLAPASLVLHYLICFVCWFLIVDKAKLQGAYDRRSSSFCVVVLLLLLWCCGAALCMFRVGAFVCVVGRRRGRAYPSASSWDC